jgi:ureidoacrylate peracid hydrolase
VNNLESLVETVRAPSARAGPELGTAGRNSYRVSEQLVDMIRPFRPARPFRLEALPQNLAVDAERSALIVVDMQNDFCHPDGWVASLGVDNARLRTLYDPINAVTAASRRAGVPVLWLNWGVRPDRLNLSPSTQHPFNPEGAGAGLGGEVRGAAGSYRLLAKGEWGAAIVDDLVQEAVDVHVDKHRISGFWDTPLDSILRNLDVTTLVFAGVNADHCVLGTMMDANFKGYDTILIEDCVATTSPDFCLQATLHNIRFCFGFTTSSVSLTAGLAGILSDGTDAA